MKVVLEILTSQKLWAELRGFQGVCQGVSTFTLGFTSQPTASVQAL